MQQVESRIVLAMRGLLPWDERSHRTGTHRGTVGLCGNPRTFVAHVSNIVKTAFPIDDARAFSLADKTPYVIVVNNKDGRGLVYQPKVFR